MGSLKIAFRPEMTVVKARQCVISMLDIFPDGIYRCSSEVMTAYDSNDGFITQMASFCV